VSDPFSVTLRDQEIAQALVQKVRVFGQRQIADHWWEGQLPNARRRLKRLANQGLVTRLTVQARSLPVFEAPLVTWRPTDPDPDFGAVAYRCQERWRLRPVRPCTAWIATDTAAHFYGGVRRGELKLATQATHDLGVAAVWLRLSQVAPQWAAAWRSEDLLAHTRRGEKLPDAFVVDQCGQVVWVIEFGGAYDKARVQAFHQDCLARQLPYQIW
jgi:hypothetical protein